MDLKRLVEITIDSSIRGFDPEDRNSHERWDLELKQVEDSLRDVDSEPDPLLLASVCAERIRIAFEASKFELSIELTAHFLHDFPATDPSYSVVASWRISALHAVEAHEAEVREALQIARKPELRGSEYVHLLATLSKRHPGCLPADEDLWQKLKQAIDGLHELGYDTLPRAVNGPMHLEELAGRVTEELRRVNRARGAAFLKDLS